MATFALARERALALLLRVTFGLLLACSTTKNPPPGDAPPAHPAAANPPSAPAAAPAGPAGAKSAGGLSWSAEPPLVARAPKSQMRAAEYTLAHDPQAELVVFYFGEGQGGAVEPNITRWLGQLTQPDGSDTAQRAQRSERSVSSMNVALVEATGTYSGGMAMPGAPAPTPQPDAMLLGAIANGPKGPVFFKLVGKRASVEAARASFMALVDSLHAAP
jgi:hypothetical protein